VPMPIIAKRTPCTRHLVGTAMTKCSAPWRRNFLAATAVTGVAAAAATARAASFGNPDEPPQGAINAQRQRGERQRSGAAQPCPSGPGAFSPPATNVGDLPTFWATYNNAPRRIQNGGWARQVTQYDFQISTEIAGVNMRLTRGGIRELHWQRAISVTSSDISATTCAIQGQRTLFISRCFAALISLMSRFPTG
jgi:hypothetical protein